MTKVLIDAGAETSIVDDQRDLTLDHAATLSLSRQLSEIEITERRETVVGTLKGVFPERRQYEFTASEGSTFYGSISEELDARYMADPTLAGLLLRPARATFLILTSTQAGAIQKEERILESNRAGRSEVVSSPN